MGISNFFRNIRDLDNCEKPRKVIGIAGAIAAITGLAYAATKCIGNWIDSKIQNNADKKREDYRAEKEQETETHKANEERATKEAQAQAQADAYERMRKADAELYREKMEIDLEKRRRIKEMAEQQNASATDEPAEGPSEPIDDLLTTDKLFNRRRRIRSWERWIVQGYIKPGQITMVTAGSGVGKSILLAEIALAAAKGVRPEFLPDSCCASIKQDVVYYRIEDYPSELEGKYGQGKVFDDSNFKWVLPENLGSRTLDGLLEHVKQLARQLEHDTVICIDPATKLDGYRHEVCIKGLEEAQRIALERGITLTPIVAAHNGEINDWKHLSSGDIMGGDKGIQQAGAVIALRNEGTADGECRFIQCLKEPKGCPDPYPNNVLVCKKVNTVIDEDNWYLHFEFVEIKPEKDALPEKPKSNKGKASTSKSEGNDAEKPKNKRLSKEDKETILNDSKNGVSSEDIANKIGCHVRSVQRVKKNNRA